MTGKIIEEPRSGYPNAGEAIEYHGLHYVGAQHYPSKIISEEEFESRWLQLAAEAKEMD